MSRKNPIFFGWYIVITMVFGMMLAYGIRSSFSIFFPHVLDTFHWDRGVTSIMFSINLLVCGITAPIAGALVDRWKPRVVVTIGILLLGFSIAACYFANQLWHYYVLFGVLVPIGTALCGSPALNPAIVNWFLKRRGLVMGLGQIGGSFGFAYVMLLEWVMGLGKWQNAFLVMGGMVIVVMLPLYLLFYYNRPEDKDKNMKAYGAVDIQVKAGENLSAEPEWTVRRAIKTCQLWLLVFSVVCFWGLGNYLVMAHQIKFAEDAGFSSLTAATVFALYGIFSIPGQLASAMSDKIGRENTVILAIILSLAGLGALMAVRNTSDMWMLYVYAICGGSATGLYTPTSMVAAADLYHGKNIGAIAALEITGVGLGGMLGPWLGGYIFDVQKSYMLAFAISMAAYIAAGISFWMAAPRHADKLKAKMLKKYRTTETNPEKTSPGLAPLNDD
jgi:MFS family permease